jgi:WD40 repeat protein
MKPESDPLGQEMASEKRPPAGNRAKSTIVIGSGHVFFGAAALLFLAAAQLALGQTSEPILRLEVGAHNAGVFSMALDPSNRILVTGSEDKTVRTWDISGKGDLLRILRPPVGEWEQGNIFAVALSPDTGTVACGGRTGTPQHKDGCVYLFDRTSGALTRRLGGLPGWVQGLAYTPDGRFLAAVTGEGGGKADWSSLLIYRLPDYAVAAEDKDYGDFIKAVVSSPSGSLIATACYDGFIRLYDLSGWTSRDGSSPRPLPPASKIRPAGGRRPWGLAFSPDGTRLAVGYELEAKVEVLQVGGNALDPAYSPNTSIMKSGPFMDFRTVAWSPDGRFLFAAGGFRSKGAHLVRRWDDGGRGTFKNLPVESDLALFHMLPLQQGGVVFASRDGSFGRINAREETALLGAQATPTYRNLHAGFRLSADGSAIEFAYRRGGQAPAVFEVNERRLTDSGSGLWQGLKAGVSLHSPITEGLPVSDWRNSPAPKLQGRPLEIIKHDISLSLAIKPDRSGFLLGAGSHLYCFDSAGRTTWKKRTPSPAFALNTNGRVAAAGLGDGTIRWYRASDGKEVLAFFPHPDRRRWALWTPSGFYDASPGGEDFIGWHVNNGKEQAADFFPNSRFRSTYYRPDVIDRVLATMDEAEALRLASEKPGRKPAETASVRDQLPPVVAIAAPADGTGVSAASVKVHYSARSREALTRLRVLVDGRPVSVEGTAQAPPAAGELSVPIPPRDCAVSVIAENRHAASEPATIRLRWKKAPAREGFEVQPKLYVLSVGVSAYQDRDIRLDLAAKDAADFGAAWNEQHGRLYSGVEVKALTDAQATKGNILDGLEWLQRQVTAKDIAVLFFAGHGINDPTGVFYFLPVDADLEKLKRTGISQADITSTVAGIAGKVLVFMDACHSGNLMGKLQRRGVVVVNAVVNELASAENGAVVFSSAMGRQYALENAEWGNGAFTKGVVEGLRGKADYTGSGRITVNMLDLYVSERVKELTKGQQTPTTVKPPNVPDFPVALLR